MSESDVRFFNYREVVTLIYFDSELNVAFPTKRRAEEQQWSHCCLPQLFEIEFERDEMGKNSLQLSCEIDLDGKSWQ